MSQFPDDQSEPQAAVALVHSGGPEESILLIRRATNPRDPWSGHWSFPGGRRELTDIDLIDTALRELYEECGIVLPRDYLVETLPVADAGRRTGRIVRVAPFAFRVPEPLPTRVDPCEAAEALWLPVGTLADLSRHRMRPVPGLPEDLLFPAIDLNDIPLWGFTYRILCEWLKVDPRLSAV
jgi:8-oxo-dGTP pyrophosphatase MutT (NUDIX family)